MDLLHAAKKKSDLKEVFVNIFEYCNLNCSFCWQNHEDKKGMDTILTTLKDSLFLLIERTAEPTILFNMMGGELFANSVPPRVIRDYIRLGMLLKNKCAEHNKQLVVNWVTNMVVDMDRVIDVVSSLRAIGLNTYYTTSYDPRGRFTKQTRNRFFKNLNSVHEKPRCISVVMTKQNIEAIINFDQDFDTIYKNGYDIYCDFYSPEKSAHLLMPTEDEVEQFFAYLVLNYPKVNPVSEWIGNRHGTNTMSCRRSDIVDATGFKGCCGSLVEPEQKKNQFLIPVVNLNNFEIEANYMTIKNCLQCEYFKRCSIGCFLNHNNQYYQLKHDGCAYKNTYRLIDETFPQ